MHRQQLELLLTDDLLLQGHWGKEDAAVWFSVALRPQKRVVHGDRVGTGRESERLDRGNLSTKTGETVDRRQNNGNAAGPAHKF